MSRRPARFTKAEIARVFRELRKHEGVAAELLPNGTIRCVPYAVLPLPDPANPKTDDTELAEFRAKHGYE